MVIRLHPQDEVPLAFELEADKAVLEEKALHGLDIARRRKICNSANLFYFVLNGGCL